MSTFSNVLVTKLATMDPPLLAKSMLAFSSLKYEPDRTLVKAYYMQVCGLYYMQVWGPYYRRCVYL